MTYATELIQNYRLALHVLWNHHFWRDHGYRDGETVRDFERCQPSLFRALVGRRLEPLAEPSDQIFGPAYRAVPGELRQFPVLMVTPKAEYGGSREWQNLPGPFSAGQVELSLLDFFDWSVREWRDFRYYRTRIHAFEDRPDLVGGEALVEVLQADVIWNPGDSLELNAR